MAPKRLKRLAFAGWLGLLALGIQSLMPVLVAAEIESAGAEADGGAFTLCVFGHLHPAGSPEERGKSPASGHPEGTVCPICLALQASPPFTAPAPIALPLPSGQLLDALVAVAAPASERIATAAYRSRAPPLG